MPRITPEERAKFKAILDKSIDKMNRPKNAEKRHWSNQSLKDLYEHLHEEVTVELYAEIFDIECAGQKREAEAIDECYDVINIALMIIDNLQGNK